MSENLIKRLIILGGFIIVTMIFIQTYILLKTWDIKDKEFDQSVRIMLRVTAERLADFHETELPKSGLIQRTASNYYAVNINSHVDANILEDYLIQEMGNHSIKTDFEYAVYDCFSKNLVYGNYCKLSDGNITPEHHTKKLPTFDDLDYYFVVSFPSRESYLLSNMNLAVIFSLISVLAVIFFIYSIYIILKQKRLSELQKDFINNMTHEFKTPISSIKIAADAFAKNEFIKGDNKLSQYATIIQDQNARLNNQVEKVLNLARLEEDSFKLKKERISVHTFLAKIINAENMRLKKDVIHKDFADVEILIEADALHFTNIITNIIDNAEKYSTPEINITVKTRVKDNTLFIHIVDTGIGMEKTELNKIFEKFYRISTGNIHDVKGFGLGLFYVKNIVEAHGWDIDVTSKAGAGTSFIIKIPMNHERRS